MTSQLGADGLGYSFEPDLAGVYTTLGRPSDALALLGPSIRSVLRSGASNNLMMLLCASLLPLTMCGSPDAAMHTLARCIPSCGRVPTCEIVGSRVVLGQLESAMGRDVVQAQLDGVAPMTLEAAGLVVAEAIEGLHWS